MIKNKKKLVINRSVIIIVLLSILLVLGFLLNNQITSTNNGRNGIILEGKNNSYGDYTLVQYKKGNRTILIDSINSLFSKKIEALSFNIFSQPKDSPEVYFTSINDDTDTISLNFYSYNLETNKFKKLTVSKFYSFIGTPRDHKIISPDGRKVISIFSDKIYVLFLDKDSYVLVDKINNRESDSFYWSCNMGCNTNVTWVDNDSIEYSIYDISQVKVREDGLPPLATVGKYPPIKENKIFNLE